ncbi:MAG: radical SAM protein [Deltaproteobacteria bacterium]|jgi:hypothetical protein|nr:radical SAM protein [Deltaproteobacteria bacterium]MBW2536767.1 radical SAM protein [Deltaproteobacteria bacterium]
MTESVADRMRLIERLLSRSVVDPRHNVPMPGGKPRRPWSGADVVAAWRRLEEELAAGLYRGHYYNLYVHLPFCPADCSFCMYDHQVSRDEALARRYVDGLRRQIDGYGPLLERVSFQNLLIGGGTPTWLSEPLLAEVLDAVGQAFQFAPRAAKVIEANPGDVTASSARLLADRGLNAVSIGVHSLEPNVLDAHGRGFQTVEQVETAIRHLRDADVAWVECDLLVGLWGDSAAGVRQSAAQLMAWSPDGLTLTKLRPRRSYLEQHYGGDSRRFGASLRERFTGLADPLATSCRDAGFEPGRLDADELTWKVRRIDARLPFDDRRRAIGHGGPTPSSTLGLGRFAHSKICGQLLVEHRQAIPTHALDESHYFGVEADRSYEASRYICHHLVRHGAIDHRTYRDLFAADLHQDYPHVLRELEALGELGWDGALLRAKGPSERERFVVSRVFMSRQSAVQELSMEDREVLQIHAGPHRFRVRVDHLRADRPAYFATAGSVGLLLESSTATGSARERVLLGALTALLRRIARPRPWLAAIEVADWLAAELPRAVASHLPVTVRVGGDGGD